MVSHITANEKYILWIFLFNACCSSYVLALTEKVREIS